MGVFKNSLKLVNEFVTLGGASRLEQANRAYEEAHGRLEALVAQANGCKTRINVAVVAIGSALTHAKPQLESAERLIKSRSEQWRDFDVALRTETLQRFERFNAGMNSAIGVGVGSIAGGTMAVGAWSLVTLFGSASTGAAISGLSGVAATNATLAWFGGGALAAGGAGMVGGMTVLGGIVAIPLVYVAAKSTHKKAKQREHAKAKVEETIVGIRKELETLPAIVEHVEAKRRVAERLCTDVVAKIVELKKVIRPFGLLSLLTQKVLAMLGKQPYSKAQSDAIADLTSVLATFLAAFDAQASSATLRTRETLD
ncbi:hypothetical protein ACVNIS_08605 [Sphaerotilaceae bacterium SBD11-9]